jgi:hypothetical protein
MGGFRNAPQHDPARALPIPVLVALELDAARAEQRGDSFQGAAELGGIGGISARPSLGLAAYLAEPVQQLGRGAVETIGG